MKKFIFLIGFITVLFGHGTAMAAPFEKTEICHFPPGNTANFHTQTVAVTSLPAHEKHGDYLDGPCEDIDDSFCDDGDSCTQNIFNSETGACENPAMEICKPDSVVCPCAAVLEVFGERSSFANGCFGDLTSWAEYSEFGFAFDNTFYLYKLGYDGTSADGFFCSALGGVENVNETQMSSAELNACRLLALANTDCLNP